MFFPPLLTLFLLFGWYQEVKQSACSNEDKSHILRMEERKLEGAWVLRVPLSISISSALLVTAISKALYVNVLVVRFSYTQTWNLIDQLNMFLSRNFKVRRISDGILALPLIKDMMQGNLCTSTLISTHLQGKYSKTYFQWI